jgi:putative ABC transport system permease protein
MAKNSLLVKCVIANSKWYQETGYWCLKTRSADASRSRFNMSSYDSFRDTGGTGSSLIQVSAGSGTLYYSIRKKGKSVQYFIPSDLLSLGCSVSFLAWRVSMSSSIHPIELTSLVIAFIPVAVVLGILFKWSMRAANAAYAFLRMLLQLMLVGYFLAFIFKAGESWIILLVLTVMVFASSWIALGATQSERRQFYPAALLSITLSGGAVLALVTQGVLHLDPWFLPRYVIPLAGMTFASSMNSVSLSAERLMAEIANGKSFDEARRIAFQAALIPVINSLFAVGIVSLPGMMTGQILSGVSPLIAARYQIMVMCMLFGCSGMSAACFLWMVRGKFQGDNPG